MGIKEFFKSKKQRKLDILQFKKEEQEEQLKQNEELRIAENKENRKKIRKAEKEKKYLASKNAFELKYKELVEEAKNKNIFSKVLWDDIFLCKITEENAENDNYRFVLPIYYNKDGYKKAYAYILSEHRFTDKIDDYTITPNNLIDWFVVEGKYMYSAHNHSHLNALDSYINMMHKADKEAIGIHDLSVNADELIAVEKDLNDYYRDLKLRNEKINKNVKEVKQTYHTSEISN